MAAAILLSACGGESTNASMDGNAGSNKPPKPSTTLGKAAQDYCDCTEGVDWSSIDMADPNDPDLMPAFQKIAECSMETSKKYGLPPITFNEGEIDSMRNEMILRCPEVIKKCDEMSRLITAKFNGG